MYRKGLRYYPKGLRYYPKDLRAIPRRLLAPQTFFFFCSFNAAQSYRIATAVFVAQKVVFVLGVELLQIRKTEKQKNPDGYV